MTDPNFSRAEYHEVPFPHFRVPGFLSEQTADSILQWLDADAPWKLRITDFYEQYEFSILDRSLPAEISHIRSSDFVDAAARELSRQLEAPALVLVDACFHRLTKGQTIRLHNDHIGGEETHRLVVQINRGWSVEQGGLFMLFENDDAESVTDVILPVHRSAFGFEISERSHHAVSTVHSGNRDTLVYTYRKAR